MNVFNAQSDAVIVFNQIAQPDDKDQGFAQQSSTGEPPQEKLPELLFTNRESVDLFGIDLQELKR